MDRENIFKLNIGEENYMIIALMLRSEHGPFNIFTHKPDTRQTIWRRRRYSIKYTTKIYWSSSSINFEWYRNILKILTRQLSKAIQEFYGKTFSQIINVKLENMIFHLNFSISIVQLLFCCPTVHGIFVTYLLLVDKVL